MTAKVECFTTLVLALTAIYSYGNEAYASAVVIGACAGFVGGIALTKMLYRWRA